VEIIELSRSGEEKISGGQETMGKTATSRGLKLYADDHERGRKESMKRGRNWVPIGDP